MAKRPNSTMVVAAWINTVPALSAAGVRAASELPDDLAAIELGFVTVTVIGGDKSGYEPFYHPVVQVNCYAGKAGRPLWSKAQNIVQEIKDAAEADQFYLDGGRLLTLSARGVSYGNAQVLECGSTVNTEERRLYDDRGQVANWQFDMDFFWTVQS